MSLNRNPLPRDGFRPEELERFWSFVDKRVDGHWVWTRIPPSGQWFFVVRSRPVLPNRIAWALAHPNESIPRLRRSDSCTERFCVNPACWRPCVPTKPIVGPKPPRQREYVEIAPALDPSPTALGDRGLGIPPIVEAYAALQFGLPVKPRPLAFRGRAVEVPSRPQSEAATAPVVVVKRPVGAAVVNPTQQDMEAAEAGPWNDPVKLLDFIFTPGTCVMTFQDHVWLWNSKVRVDAPDGPRALVAALTLMGLRKTAE